MVGYKKSGHDNKWGALVYRIHTERTVIDVSNSSKLHRGSTLVLYSGIFSRSEYLLVLRKYFAVLDFADA